MVKFEPLLSMRRRATAAIDPACSTPRSLDRCTTGDRSAARSAPRLGRDKRSAGIIFTLLRAGGLLRVDHQKSLRAVRHRSPVVRRGVARQTDGSLALPFGRPARQLEVALEHLRDAVHAAVPEYGAPPESTGKAPARSLSMPPSSASWCASPTGHNESDSIHR